MGWRPQRRRDIPASPLIVPVRRKTALSLILLWLRTRARSRLALPAGRTGSASITSCCGLRKNSELLRSTPAARRSGDKRINMAFAKLVLVRHGESVWNAENRFTGWTDVDLSEKGRAEAQKAVEVLKAEGYTF